LGFLPVFEYTRAVLSRKAPAPLSGALAVLSCGLKWVHRNAKGWALNRAENKMKAELIYNAHAGHGIHERDLEAIVEYLERNGWGVVVRKTGAPGEATTLALRAAAQGVDVVISGGGDGTVNEIVNGLVGSETALGVLPMGTGNVWALQMGIPTLSPLGPAAGLARLVGDLEGRMERPLPVNVHRPVLLDAARVLVEGQVRAVDVGQVNDRHFVMWAGIGLDAEVTIRVSREDKRAFGSWAFVGSALDVLREYKSVPVRLILDGVVRQVKTSLIVVSNIQLYGGALPIGARACVDDGLLDVCVFKGEGLLNYVQQVLKVAARQHLTGAEPDEASGPDRASGIEYYQSQEIVVESSTVLPVHVDDEPFAKTPVTIRALPRALRVLVPRDAPHGLFVGEGRPQGRTGAGRPARKP
jgi:diacylglycerol kinase (ATP)